MRKGSNTDKERQEKINRARAYTRRKLNEGVNDILKSNKRKITFQSIVDLHDSLNIKCY